MGQLHLEAAVAITLVLLAADSLDAVRFSRSSRIVRVSSYRSSRYSYSSFSGPVYSRRLTPSLMGPLYFRYASSYPMHFSYRSPLGVVGSTCHNYLALDNGSYVGTFSCPFLPDEPTGWTRCCGYETEGFCCDPAYDDSWKFAGLGALAIVMIVGGCLVGLGVIIGLTVFCCVVKKRRARLVGGQSSVMQQQQGKPFVDPASRQVSGSNPLPPPYPTMEYGTIQPPPAGASNSGVSPYPPQPPPYPLPYAGPD